MGGRGSSSGGRGRYPGGGVSMGNISNVGELVTERGAKQTEVDAVLTAFRGVYSEYGYTVDEIQLADVGGKDSGVLAYYDGANIAFNRSYFDAAKMDKAYEASVKQGFHPSSGGKSGLEAVAAHELGHGLTDAVADKMGITGMRKIDTAATRIVNEARKQTGHKGVVQLARKISEYATSSNAEAIAEAVADVYCNGKKAKKESTAIVNVINGYLK